MTHKLPGLYLNPLLSSGLLLAFCTILLTGCNSKKSVEVLPADNEEKPVTPSNIPVTAYTDDKLTLNYPADWTVHMGITDIPALLVAEETNEFGGHDSCRILYQQRPDTSLIALTDELLLMFQDIPEPEIAFITVNGEPAARVSGIGSTGIGTTSLISQLIYKNNTRHEVVCFGESDAEFGILFESVEVF